MKALIFVVLFFVVITALVALPTIDIDVDAVVASNAFAYIRAAMYFIPVRTVINILSTLLTIWLFRMIVSFVKMVWDILPVA